MVLRAGGRQRVGGDKVYIEYLHVNKLQITLSFLPSPGMCLLFVQSVFVPSCVASATKLLLVCDHQYSVLCPSPHGTLSVPKCKLGHGLELSSKLAAVRYILLHGFELLCKWASPFMLHCRGVQRVSVVHQCSRGGGRGLSGAGPPTAAPPPAWPPGPCPAGAFPLHAGCLARPHQYAGLFKRSR